MGRFTRRTTLTIGVALGLVLLMAAPAFAVIHGDTRQTYTAGCDAGIADVYTNQHDIKFDVQGVAQYRQETAACTYNVEVDYINLYKGDLSHLVQSYNPALFWQDLSTAWYTKQTDWATNCNIGNSFKTVTRFRFRWFANGQWNVGAWQTLGTPWWTTGEKCL